LKEIAILLLTLTFSAQSKPVKTCLDYTPFVIVEDGKKKWNGPNIETLHHISKELNIELDTSVRAPFVRCMEELKNGRVDAIAGLIYTKERDKLLHLLPYSIKKQLAVFYLKDNKEKIDLNAMLPNQTIGMHRAFALPDEIIQSTLAKHLVPIGTVDSGLNMALRGRIDGVMATILLLKP